MVEHNYFSDKRKASNPWEGYSMYRVYRDGEGKFFERGLARFVIFDHDVLVGEFDTLRAGDIAFLSGVRVEGGIKKPDYKGLGGR